MTKTPTPGVVPAIPVVVAAPVPARDVVVLAGVAVPVAAKGLKAMMMVATVVMKLVPVASVTGDVVVVAMGVVVTGVVVIGVVETGVVVIGVELMELVLIGVVVVAGKATVLTVGVTAVLLTVLGVVATLEVLTVGTVDAATLPAPVPAVPAREARGTEVPPMTMQMVPSMESTSPGGQIPSDTTRFTWTPVCAKAEADAKPSAAMADAAATRAVIRERVERMMVSSINACESDSSIGTEFCPFRTKRTLGGNPRSRCWSTRFLHSEPSIRCAPSSVLHTMERW